MDEIQHSTQLHLRVCCCYAQEDERFVKDLEKHLSLLKSQNEIQLWHRYMVTPGAHYKKEISSHLLNSNMILLFISPDFLNSDSLYNIEMQTAIKRHDAGEAIVIPVLLRSVDCTNAPFSHLQSLPRNGKPVANWNRRDDAFLAIVKEIRELIESLKKDNEFEQQDNHIHKSTSDEDKKLSFRQSFEEQRISDFYQQQYAFDELLRRVLPGSRGHIHIQDNKRINKILSELAIYAENYDLCFFRGSGWNRDIKIHSLSDNIWLVDKFECLISGIWVYRSLRLERQYILIHRSPLAPSGAYSKEIYDELLKEYFEEEVGLYKGIYITREEYDDGYALLNDLVHKIEYRELRLRNLKDDFIILAPQYSVFNNGSNSGILEDIYRIFVNAQQIDVKILELLDALKRPRWMEYLD